ncbi:hypothetical protein pEaSNUABM8_00120 [Erwinia phage pEa_SNUABM_8]|nr:hypothetical protein pEaSNUABM8_00120 [Erwinia phage pEa_SNUABM_8]QVW54872.1 hypothetical protein pEaSNUABM4_00119 [Erwinia phage pEa_SNUABM_4]
MIPKKHHINLEKSINEPIGGLQTNPYLEEVGVFDNPDAVYSIHFFRDVETKYSAKGVVVLKETKNICRVLPSMADMVKVKGKMVWKPESFYYPMYILLGEIAFKRWLGKPDVREALAINDEQFIKDVDALWHSLLVHYKAACAVVRPNRRGLWDYEILTWGTNIRFQYDGKERRGHRKLTYRFSKDPRKPNRVEVEYRFDVNKRDTDLPTLTLRRKYPLESWPNTKAFVTNPKNMRYLDILYEEAAEANK